MPSYVLEQCFKFISPSFVYSTESTPRHPTAYRLCIRLFSLQALNTTTHTMHPRTLQSIVLVTLFFSSNTLLQGTFGILALFGFMMFQGYGYSTIQFFWHIFEQYSVVPCSSGCVLCCAVTSAVNPVLLKVQLTARYM
jgi:hypothetical protein